ncbi:MAG: RNA recognition motif domain-containing protein [Prevotella sp.]|jgi:RNA recognition motif-containing protein
MNIFVSNINYRTQNESLLNLFASYGEVSSARIITDRETGRSRGFGFVEMPNDDEAQTAIEALNGNEFEEKVLNVAVARPREARSPRGGYSDGRRGYGRGNRY